MIIFHSTYGCHPTHIACTLYAHISIGECGRDPSGVAPLSRRSATRLSQPRGVVRAPHSLSWLRSKPRSKALNLVPLALRYFKAPDRIRLQTYQHAWLQSTRPSPAMHAEAGHSEACHTKGDDGYPSRTGLCAPLAPLPPEDKGVPAWLKHVSLQCKNDPISLFYIATTISGHLSFSSVKSSSTISV